MRLSRADRKAAIYFFGTLIVLHGIEWLLSPMAAYFAATLIAGFCLGGMWEGFVNGHRDED